MLVANYNLRSESPPEPGRPGATAPVRSRELSERCVLITASCDIDASTAPDLCARIQRHAAGYRQLVLDLSAVEFFGTAGYSLLQRMHARCAHAAVDWVLVAGPEVQRLLRVCDPEAIVPTAANIVSAVATLARITQLRNGLR